MMSMKPAIWLEGRICEHRLLPCFFRNPFARFLPFCHALQNPDVAAVFSPSPGVCLLLLIWGIAPGIELHRFRHRSQKFLCRRHAGLQSSPYLLLAAFPCLHTEDDMGRWKHVRCLGGYGSSRPPIAPRRKSHILESDGGRIEYNISTYHLLTLAHMKKQQPATTPSEVQWRWLNQIPQGHSVANKERSLSLRGAIRQLGVAPRGGDEKHHHSDRLQDQGPIRQENSVETTLILKNLVGGSSVDGGLHGNPLKFWAVNCHYGHCVLTAWKPNLSITREFWKNVSTGNGVKTKCWDVVGEVKDLKGHKNDGKDAVEDQVDQWREPIRRCYLGAGFTMFTPKLSSQSGD